MSVVDEIAAYLEVGRQDIAKFLYAAPARYRIYSIPKRSGGERVIAQPSSTLKVIQRFVVNAKLSKFPIHEAAAAYVDGKGISDNAKAHIRSKYILKLDFVNFFNSLSPRDFHKVVGIYDDKHSLLPDMFYYERILFWGAGSFFPKMLSVGAPSSPALSNIIMYRFDDVVSKAARDIGAVYTRYADDITISASDRETCLKIERVAIGALKDLKYPSLKFNADKRGLYGRGERRMVTGLIITPDEAISIGRDRKRQISSMVHRASLGQLDARQMNELKGLLGFAHAAEPAFVDTLRRKYGERLILTISRYQGPALP
jgi:RNA-directed DNA polymerase